MVVLALTYRLHLNTQDKECTVILMHQSPELHANVDEA